MLSIFIHALNIYFLLVKTFYHFEINLKTRGLRSRFYSLQCTTSIFDTFDINIKNNSRSSKKNKYFSPFLISLFKNCNTEKKKFYTKLNFWQLKYDWSKNTYIKNYLCVN